MDEIFENLKKVGVAVPQNGALTPKKGAKSKNTPFRLTIGTVTNLGMENPILDSIFENGG